MSLRKTFKTDQRAETEGVWLDVGEHKGKPQRIKLARASRSNKKYAAVLERNSRPHMSAIHNDTLDEGVAQRMMRDTFIDANLLDWENIPLSEITGQEKDEDTDLAFTRENVERLFEELPDLYLDWERRAKSAAAFREIHREEAAKN